MLGPLVLSSCAAAPFLVPIAFEFAKNLFQTGLQNYGSKHRDNLSHLVNRLSSPYMQGLPPMAMGGPALPGQPGQLGQPGVGMQPGFPGQPGMPPPQYPGQAAYPGQMGGYDPNLAGTAFSGAAPYPGSPANPYGGAQSLPGQPGMNPFDPSNPYGTNTVNPYGQQTNPYGTTSPSGQQVNPYGTAGATPYGTPNPYGNSNPYGAQNPYGSPNPYGQPANPYGTTNPYGASPSQMQPGYDPNNPYGAGGAMQGYGQVQQGYGQVQPGYGQVQPGYAQAQQGYGQVQPDYGQVQPGYGQVQPGYGQSGTYGMQQQAYANYGMSGQSYGGQPYGAAGIYPRSVDGEPVAVDVALVRQKQTATGKEVVLMNDGEILKDGGANTEAGDRFKIVARTNCDCYLYIISIDGSGWAETVFPAKGAATANPVKQDEEYSFPESSYWYTLDQVKGIETFFVVASRNRRTDLEESMAQLAAEVRPSTPIVAKVEEPPVIPRGVGSVQTRGIVKVQDDTGTKVQVTPLSYAANPPAQDVTVTRWFNHE